MLHASNETLLDPTVTSTAAGVDVDILSMFWRTGATVFDSSLNLLADIAYLPVPEEQRLQSRGHFFVLVGGISRMKCFDSSHEEDRRRSS